MATKKNRTSCASTRKSGAGKSPSYECLCNPCCPLDCMKHKNEDFGEEECFGEEEQPAEFPCRAGETEGEREDRCVLEKRTAAGDGDSELGDICSTGNILDRLIFDPAKQRRPNVCPWKSHARFETMVPEDAKNDHQYYASLQKSHLDSMCCLRVTSTPRCNKQSKLVATIGPSLNTADQIEQAIHAGATLFRINMSYGDRCSHCLALEAVRTAANRHSCKAGFHVPITTIVDLKGPGIRTGKIHHHYVSNGKALLCFKKGDTLRLTIEKSCSEKCNPKVLFVDYEQFMCVVRAQMKLYIGDVKIQVDSVEERICCCTVLEGGSVTNYQRVHIPMVPIDLPALTDDDVADIDWAIQQPVDFITVTRLKNSKIVKGLKTLLSEKMSKGSKTCAERPIAVLAKITNYESLENLDDIIKEADGIIIQRGDIGMEMPQEKVFIAQKMVIAKCNIVGQPVFCTTQLMPSIPKGRDRPGLDIQDIATCIIDGADGMILTTETAVGDNPVKAINEAHHMLREADAAIMQKPFFCDLVDKLQPAIEPQVAISIAAVEVATKTRATAIIVMTSSGESARLISWFRPRCSVIGVSRFGRVARQMNSLRAVHPLHFRGPVLEDWFQDVDQRFHYSIMYGKHMCIIKSGDPLVLVSGYRKGAGFTNCLRIVYASVKPGVFIDHPRDYYDELITDKK